MYQETQITDQATQIAEMNAELAALKAQLAKMKQTLNRTWEDSKNIVKKRILKTTKRKELRHILFKSTQCQQHNYRVSE